VKTLHPPASIINWKLTLRHTTPPLSWHHISLRMGIDLVTI